ncbi:MAG: hypothetical protein ACXU8N_06635 [Telluria sp.]
MLATATLALPMSGYSETMRTLIKCKLGEGKTRIVSITTDQPRADPKRIFVKLSPTAVEVPIFGYEDERSRGSELELKCLGGREKVLLVFGEFFGSGYPRGIALRFHAGTVERIDFAERTLPKWIDLTRSGMRLIFSEHGPEIQAPYVSYRFSIGVGQDQEGQALEDMPALESGTRIEVRP